VSGSVLQPIQEERGLTHPIIRRRQLGYPYSLPDTGRRVATSFRPDILTVICSPPLWHSDLRPKLPSGVRPIPLIACSGPSMLELCRRPRFSWPDDHAGAPDPPMIARAL